MKRLVPLALLALATAAHADTEAQARKAIEARYASISKAFETKDAKTFEAGFADDFTAKAPGQPLIKRAELFKDFESRMNAFQDVTWTQTIKSFKFKGTTAHVNITSAMSAHIPGRKGEHHLLTLASKTSNDWVKTTKGWQVHYSETVELNILVDGKPMKGRK